MATPKPNIYKWIAYVLVGIVTLLAGAGITSNENRVTTLENKKVNITEYYHDQTQINANLNEIKQDIKTLLRER